MSNQKPPRGHTPTPLHSAVDSGKHRMVIHPADEHGRGKVICFMRGTMAVLADRRGPR
jgi:hypothetical protein